MADFQARQEATTKLYMIEYTARRSDIAAAENTPLQQKRLFCRRSLPYHNTAIFSMLPEKYYYLKIGNAADLKNKKERLIYRCLEILPGLIAWLTLILVIALSWMKPVWVAFFIIGFDLYWLLKTIYLSLHLRAAFGKMQRNLKIDWLEKLKSKRKNWQDIYHLIILPVYKERYEIISTSLKAIIKSHYPKDKIIIVLTVEERGGAQLYLTAQKIRKEFGAEFFKFLLTIHPSNIKGELAGKGSNITWAAREVKKEIIDPLKIPYKNIIVSALDIDTQVQPHYFSLLAYLYLKAKNPERKSFQPIPVYNNNIWEAPFFSRVVATSGTFWQMMQQQRAERLATFSSHAASFEALAAQDFWPIKNTSEDSRIFWQSLLRFNGRYKTIPLYYPVSMDVNLAKNFLRTAINVYKQQRRWGWGCENIPYLFFGFLKNKKIPWRLKIKHSFNLLEGFWSWSTNSLLIFALGWLPLFLGGEKFNLTILSYNLPRITRTLMTIAMVGLLTSAIYSTILLPPRPKNKSKLLYLSMFGQWLFLPLTILIFGAFPGLEAQTRLMFGKYMGFWVTEKEKK